MAGEDWELVWADEFDYEGPVNADKWTHELGHGRNGWGNAESQSYEDGEDVCRVENGTLRITGRLNPDGQERYTSARIHTHGKASWKYGKFEIRAKLPAGAGTWPAIWMLSDSIRAGSPWPLCGEIDIMEHVGRDPEHVHFSLHTQAHNHRIGNQATSVHLLPGVTDGFHDYGLEWDEQKIRFSVDGMTLSTMAKGDKSGPEQWPFDQPFYLIINLAIGGYMGGEIDDAALPACFEIEHARAYRGRR